MLAFRCCAQGRWDAKAPGIRFTSRVRPRLASRVRGFWRRESDGTAAGEMRCFSMQGLRPSGAQIEQNFYTEMGSTVPSTEQSGVLTCREVSPPGHSSQDS